MNVPLTDELRDFVQKKINCGEYPSEEALIAAGLNSPRDQERASQKKVQTLDDIIDQEFVEYCARAGDDTVTPDEVLRATSTIKDSMARAIIDEERAERF
jgi:Arc/MetJ-type ribon-helix-helix transcriptional regulator